MPSKRSLRAPSARSASRRNTSRRSSRPPRSRNAGAGDGVLQLDVANVRADVYAICCVPVGGDACTAVLDLKSGRATSCWSQDGRPVVEQDRLRFLGDVQTTTIAQRMPKQLPPVLRGQRATTSRSNRKASPRPKRASGNRTVQRRLRQLVKA